MVRVGSATAPAVAALLDRRACDRSEGADGSAAQNNDVDIVPYSHAALVVPSEPWRSEVSRQCYLPLLERVEAIDQASRADCPSHSAQIIPARACDGISSTSAYHR